MLRVRMCSEIDDLGNSGQDSQTDYRGGEKIRSRLLLEITKTMILLVTSFCVDNAAMLEQNLDFVFAQNDRQQIKAHILLVNPPKVDAEMRARIKISAELAFEGVHELELRPLTDDRAPKWREINNAFTQAATHISKAFRWPFFWMEPDCVPTKVGWFSRLVLEYGYQPRHYFGSRMKIETPGKPDAFIMARNSVYPVNAILEITPQEAPFEISSASNVIPKFTMSKLIQQTIINGDADLAKVREDAILVHGDKNGVLRRKLERQMAEKPVAKFAASMMADTIREDSVKVSIPIPASLFEAPEPVPVNGVTKKRGRPSKAEIARRNAVVTTT